MAKTKRKAAASKRPRGRPSKYSKALADEVCDRMSTGEALRTICESDHMPDERTVRRWVIDDVDGFSPRFARARELRAQVLVDQIVDIADTPQEGERIEEDEVFGKDGGKPMVLRKRVVEDMLGHRKLQVDARKWYAMKVLPRLYGNKVDVSHKGKVTLEQLVTGSWSDEDKEDEDDG